MILEVNRIPKRSSKAIHANPPSSPPLDSPLQPALAGRGVACEPCIAEIFAFKKRVNYYVVGAME